jgi:hypothetical protein
MDGRMNFMTTIFFMVYAMDTAMPYTILLLLNATPNWLSLSRKARQQFFEMNVLPIFSRVASTVRTRFFDSEYFHARVSDFIIVETESLRDYKLFIEMLRDTKIYAEPYFEIKDIIVGQENAFQEFDELLGGSHDND